MDLYICDRNEVLKFRRRHRREVRLGRKRKMAANAARARDNIARDIDAMMDAAIARDDEIENRRQKQHKNTGEKINKMSNDFYIQYEEKGNFPKAPAGQYQAVCVELLNHGFKTFPDPKTGAPGRPFLQGQFVFQLNKLDETTGKRFEVTSSRMNFSSLHEKAKLRQFLTQWRGHDLTEAEKEPPGLNIGGLLGVNALVQVIHVPGTKEGQTFVNIGSIMPLMEGMPKIDPLNYEPRQAKIDAIKAAAAANGTPTHSGQPQATPAEQAAVVDADIGW